jgi:hypothetical protein
MATPVSFFHMQFLDYSVESSGVKLPITTLTAANFVAETALIAALETAIDGVSMCNLVGTDTIAVRQRNLNGASTNRDAQREKKWLARYHDFVTNKKYRVEIPCADLSILAPASDFADTANAAFIALKTAWELVVRSPDDNNLTILDSLEFVGREL